MTKIETNNKAIALSLDCGDQVTIGFDPDGVNAVVGAPPLIFLSIGTFVLPNGKMGVSVRLPPENAYRHNAAFVVIDANEADSVTFGEAIFDKLKHDDNQERN